MTNLYKILVATAVLSTALTSTVFAKDRETVTASVSYAGIDLGSIAGQAAFKRRVHLVASDACQSLASDRLVASWDRTHCMREMEQDGATRLALLVARSNQQLAVIGNPK